MADWKIPPIEINVGPPKTQWAAFQEWFATAPFGYHRGDKPQSFSPEHQFQLWLLVAFCAGYRAAISK